MKTPFYFLFKKINWHKLAIALIVLLCIFFLAGGIADLNIYQNGARTYSDWIQANTAPFFAGFVLIGFFGLILVVKHPKDMMGLIGLIVVAFCIISIEVIFQMIGGNKFNL